MAYGTLKCDNIVFDNGGTDKLVTVSGLFFSTSGALTVTGTISGGNVTAPTATFATLTGTTTAGTTATFTSGSFTTLTGTTVTGTTANFVSGVFTTQVSGATITGTTVATTTGSFVSLTGTTATFTSGIIASGTAALPSLAILSDPNTGIYSPGADQLAISTSGSKRFFVDATGSIGIAGASGGDRYLALMDETSTYTGNLKLQAGGGSAGFGGGIAMYGHSHASFPGAVWIGQSSGASGGIRFGLGGNGVSGTEWMRITSAGLVGVGTSSPSTLLHLSSSSSEYLRIQNTTAGNSVYLGNSAGTGILQVDGANSLKVITNSSDRLIVTSAGFVGIGTSVPGAPVNIVSNHSSGALTTSLKLATVGGYAPNSGTSLDFGVDQGDYSTWLTARIGAPRTGDNYGGSLVFYTNRNTSATDIQEAARIDSSGRVGVGTTSPSSALHVVGTTTLNGTQSFTANSTTGSYGTFQHNGTIVGDIGTANQAISSGSNTDFAISTRAATSIVFGINTTEKARLDSSGRLGIGTSAPTAPLDVAETSGSALRLRRITSGNNVDVNFFNPITTAGDVARIRMDGDGVSNAYGALSFWTTQTPDSLVERLRITSAGLVGIGTTSPSTYNANLAVFDGAGDGAVAIAQSTSSTRLQSNGQDFYINLKGTGSTVFRRGASDTESARIDSSGRLLVGTSTARSSGLGSGISLLVEGAPDTINIGTVRNSNNASSAKFVLAKTRGSAVGSNTAVQSDDSLGVLEFDGADGTQLLCGASIEVAVDGTPGANDMPGRLVFSTTADGAASPTEAMRINSAGQIGLGDTNPAAAAERVSIFSKNLAGIEYCSVSTVPTASTAYHQRFVNTNGVVGSISTTAVATLYSTSSDYRLKENVTPVLDGIARFKQLKPSRFNFIADPDKTVDGFLAHEVQEVVPEAIIGEKDKVDDDGNPVYQGIDQSKLVPLLTAALQEAIARIETLETEVTALKGA